MEDAEAIARLRRGELAALQCLVERYELEAVRVAYMVLRERAAAEDVVRAAFINLYDHADGFDTAKPFRPWFLRSVVNRARRTAARESRSVAWPDDKPHEQGPIDPGPGLEETFAALETSAAIWAAMAKLSLEQRTAIVLRYYLDLSESEMAERLSVPAGTVKSRLYNARQRLRKLLPDWLSPGTPVESKIRVAPAPGAVQVEEKRPR